MNGSIFYIDKAVSFKQSESLYNQIKETIKLHHQVNIDNDCNSANNEFLMKMFEMYRETNTNIINSLLKELCVFNDYVGSKK
jgi:hypothetical protein